MTYARKTDDSQKPIVEALRKAGAHVFCIGWPVDLLVQFRGSWHVLECKTLIAGKARRRKDQPEQQVFIRLTGTPVVGTPQEALQAIGAEAI